MSVASLVERSSAPLFYSPCILQQLLLVCIALCTLTASGAHSTINARVRIACSIFKIASVSNGLPLLLLMCLHPTISALLDIAYVYTYVRM